ncbi:hypothetical protein T484DRAFT_1900736, partial [Baffinella frigidus]
GGGGGCGRTRGRSLLLPPLVARVGRGSPTFSWVGRGTPPTWSWGLLRSSPLGPPTWTPGSTRRRCSTSWHDGHAGRRARRGGAKSQAAQI